MSTLEFHKGALDPNAGVQTTESVPTALQLDLQAPPRFHSLDALRASAMLLGILLHAAISFTEPSAPNWPVHDCSRRVWDGALVLTIHAFRMEIFFIMAGFFAYMLLTRRGVKQFMIHRVRRVGLPFVVSAIVLLPMLHAIFHYGYQLRGLTASQMPANEHWFHLWFLLYLMVLYVASVIILPVTEAILATQWPDQLMAWLLRSPLKPLFMAVLTVPLLYNMKSWTVDLTETYWPQWHILLYYGFFFGFGWLLYRQRHLLDECGRFWRTYMVTGCLLVLPVMLALITKSPRAGGPGEERFHLPLLAVHALFTWMMVFGFLGLFVRRFSHPSRRMRYVSDASYWLYLAHLPLVVCLQLAIRNVQWPTLPKLMLVMAVAVTLLLLSYQYLVRYTFIGTMLNGARVRPHAPEANRLSAAASAGVD